MSPSTEFWFDRFVSVTFPLISYFLITLWNYIFFPVFSCAPSYLILGDNQIVFFIGYTSTKNCLLPNTWQYFSSCIDWHLASTVSVDIVSCILQTLNIWSALYLCASGSIADLVRFCGVALRVSTAGDILSPHLSLRYSTVVLECLFLYINVRGILTSFMVSICS